MNAGLGLGLQEILGKTISHVVVKERDHTPRRQVFLVFSDDTWYEIYSSEGDLSGGKRVYEGGVEAVRGYMRAHDVVIEPDDYVFDFE